MRESFVVAAAMASLFVQLSTAQVPPPATTEVQWDCSGEVCRDPKYGVSIRLMQGWKIEEVSRWGNQETTVRFIDPKGEASAALYFQIHQQPSHWPAFSELDRELVNSVENKSRQRRSLGRIDFRARTNSYTLYYLRTGRAFDWIADYTDEGVTMAEYFTRVRTPHTTVLFFTALKPEMVESFRQRFDSIIQSLRVP
jgi:hypothetical protein